MIELGRESVEHAVAHPVQGSIGGPPEVERPLAVVTGQGKRQPPPVRRPGVVEDPPEGIVGHLGELLVGHRHHQHLAVVVADRQPRPIGRPAQAVQLANVVGGERHRGARTVLGRQVDLVLAAHVRNERNRCAVRRPHRVPVVGVGGVGEVARRPLLDGHREHVPARREDGALALGGEVEPVDEPGGGIAPRPAVQAVVWHGDREPRLLPGRHIVHRQFATQLVDDAAGVVRGRPADIPRGRAGELLYSFASDVKAVQVEGAVTIGDEEDTAADPHGIALGALGVGHRPHLVGGQVVNVEVLRPPALVPFPGAKVAEQRRVDHLAPVRREVACPRGGHRQLDRQSSVDRHGVQRRLDPSAVGVAERPEQHPLAVGRPPVDLIVIPPARRQGSPCRVVRQLPGLTAPGGHHVYLLVAVVLAGEGDEASIGRELGKHLLPRVSGEPHRRAPGSGRRPEVTAVREDDPVAVDVRKAQQPGLRLSRLGHHQAGCQYE